VKTAPVPAENGSDEEDGDAADGAVKGMQDLGQLVEEQ
jgi:hypothetical protein